MKIFYTAAAEKQFEALPKTVQKRIALKMRWFASLSDPLARAKPLVGYDAYRFRIGDMRIIFQVSGDLIYVLLVMKRDSAYKDL